MVKGAWIITVCMLAACTQSKETKAPQPTDGTKEPASTEVLPEIVDKRDRASGNENGSGSVPILNPGTIGGPGVIPGSITPPPGTPPTYKIYAGEMTLEKVGEWVSADKAKRGTLAADFRYTYIPFQFLNNPKEANMARIGLSKALNSTAIDADDIVNPIDVSEGHGIVFAFNIKDLWLDKADRKWTAVSSAITKRVFSPAPQLDLRRFDGDAPVSADRLAYNLLHGGIYNQLIDTPPQGRALLRQLNAGDVNARMAVTNAIVDSPRYAQRRELPDGRAIWESFDAFFASREPKEIRWIDGSLPRFRGDGMVGDYGTVASETWAHMKNGLISYYIWGNANQERSKAEQSFVRDPLNHKNQDLLTGFCVFCHAAGVQAAPNDMWTHIEEGRVPENRVEQAKQYWTSNQELTELYLKDKRLYQEAMNKIVYAMSDGDKEFNQSLVTGSNPKEPAYFLVAPITGSRRDGDVTNYR